MGKETDELLRLAGEVSRSRPGPGDGHAHHRRRAQGHRADVHGAARQGVARRLASPAARPASSPTPTTPTPRSSTCGPTACATRSSRPGARRRRRPGRVDRPGRDVPRSGRLGHHRRRPGPRARGRRRASSTPTCPACSPPIPAWCPAPAAWPAISFDELLEMTATGCPKPAMRSVEFARSYGVRLHVRSAFTWEPGTLVTDRGGARHGAGRSSRPSPTTRRRPR